jgi:hypothetical protein
MTDSAEDEIQWTLLIISMSLLIAINAVLAYTTGRIIANRHALHIANVSIWSSALIDYERTNHGCCSHISHRHPTTPRCCRASASPQYGVSDKLPT